MSPHDNVGPEKQSRRSWFRSIQTRLIVFFTLGFVVVLVIVECRVVRVVVQLGNHHRHVSREKEIGYA